MDVFAKLDRYMKVKGLYLQSSVNPYFLEENKEHFLQICMPYFATDTTLPKQAFWRGLTTNQKETAAHWFVLQADPGRVAFDVPSVQACVYIVISGRATVETDYGDGQPPTRSVCSMGKVFGAMRLFDDPRGRKKLHDPHRDPFEKRVTATIAPGSNLLRLNILDYLRNVLEQPTTHSDQSTAALGRKMSFLNPFKHSDQVTQLLRPVLPDHLYVFMQRWHLLPTPQEQTVRMDPKLLVKADHSGVLFVKQSTRLTFNLDDMPAVVMVVMEGTVRVHVERKITPPKAKEDGKEDGRSRPSTAAGPANSHGYSGGKERERKGTVPEYYGGHQIDVATKTLPICDFDAGTVVLLRQQCFDIDRDIVGEGAAGGRSKGADKRTDTGTGTTSTAPTTTTTSSSSNGAALNTAGNVRTEGHTAITAATAATAASTPALASSTFPQRPVHIVPFSHRGRSKSTSGAYDVIFEFVTGANLLIMPKDRLELALVSTRAEVENRQSTVDIKGISKWVFRAEAMVVERISALSSWIRGSGVTVNRKKSHTMTLREIMQRKAWSFDHFEGAPPKVDLKDMVEEEERDRFERTKMTASRRLEVQSARAAAAAAIAMGADGVVGQADVLSSVWEDDLFAATAKASGSSPPRASSPPPGTRLSRPPTAQRLPGLEPGQGGEGDGGGWRERPSSAASPSRVRPGGAATTPGTSRPVTAQARPPPIAPPAGPALPATYRLADVSTVLQAKLTKVCVTKTLYKVTDARSSSYVCVKNA